MAGEEDVELRDLVAQSLEAKGVLGKIRAQLRANVFVALEEQESQEKPHPFVGEKLINFQKTKDGRQAVALVREFLEFFDLDFTTAVFDPETNASESYPGREQLARELGVDHHSDTPLLSALLKRPHTQSPPSSHPFTFASSLHPPSSSSSHPLPSHVATFPTSLTPHHLTSAHHHFANSNALPPISTSDHGGHLRLHHHHVATTTGESVATAATTSVATPTSNITMVTSSITTTTTTNVGEPLQSTTSLVKNRENDSLISSSQAAVTSKQAWVTTVRGSGAASMTSSSAQELDDFFRTLPPPPALVPPPSSLTPRVESDGSISEEFEDDNSVGSGKTTDVTQTDTSLQGDFDYQTQIIPQEQ